MEEIWKPVKGYENRYSVSNLGKVKSEDRFVNVGLKNISQCYIKGKILKYYSIKGYLIYYLSINNKRKGKLAHRLVAETFVDNPDNKPEVNHKNLIKSDNNSNNLEWCTRKENINHAKLNNVLHPPKGTKHNQCKLTIENINTIFKLKNNNISTKEIASTFKVHKSTITRIIYGKRWLHLIKNELGELIE